MTDSQKGNQGSLRQMAIGLLALAGLWNAVYWLWPVHREAPVVMASTPEAATEPAVGEDAVADDDQGDAPSQPATLVMGPKPLPEPILDGAAPQIVDPIIHDSGGLGVLPPQFELYTVRARDRNLGDIASHFYGDKSLAATIAQANPFKDPRRLAPGQVWRVPLDPDNIQGVVVHADGSPAEVESPRPPAQRYTEYVVQNRDTFGGISKMHYKTTRHAEFIYEFNRERLGLDSIRGLRAGQVLRIPERPE
ncbi:MAG: LysM peptidoglycan-binding domain-containing protein [Phycisphaerales bacterium JB060]